MKNQLVFVLVLAVCTTIMATFIFRDALKPRKVDVAVPVEAPTPILVLDVARPHKFWDAYLCGKYLSTDSDGLRIAAIDGASRVRIIGDNSANHAGGQAYIMRSILITGTSMDIHESTGRDLALIGVPLNASDAYELAFSICEIAGIPNSRIKAWWNELQSGTNSSHSKNCLQVGTAENDIRHEVSIRPSLSHDEKTPWSITYRIYFAGAAISP